MDNLKVAIGVAKHMETLTNKQITRLEAEVKALRDALEACEAQLLVDCKSGAMEVARDLYGSASHWQEYMPPAWKQARTALGTASADRGEGGKSERNIQA